MPRHPLMLPTSSAATVIKAESTILAHLPDVLGNALVPINGTLMTPAQIVALVQRHLDALAMLATLRAEIKAAIQESRTQRAAVRSAVVCIRYYVLSKFGEHSEEYASLGFSPRKVGVKTAEAKALAVQKLRATRKARHTMGRKQRAAIKGVLP